MKNLNISATTNNSPWTDKEGNKVPFVDFYRIEDGIPKTGNRAMQRYWGNSEGVLSGPGGTVKGMLIKIILAEDSEKAAQILLDLMLDADTEAKKLAKPTKKKAVVTKKSLEGLI